MGLWESRLQSRWLTGDIEKRRICSRLSFVPNVVKVLLVVFSWFISASFVHAAPAVQFRSASTNIAGYGPRSVEVADLRGQGKIDVITANRLGNNVSVLLHHGDGTFTAATNFPTYDGPQTTATGDFDADGTIDVIVANNPSDVISWCTLLRGQADGS